MFFYSLTRSQRSNVSLEIVQNEFVSKADAWKAVPDSAYNEEIKEPAIVYGVYHLLRFLGKKLINYVSLTYSIFWYNFKH